MSGNKNEEIVNLVTDIAYKFKRLEDLLGVPINQSNSNLLAQAPIAPKEPVKEEEPQIKTFNVSGYNSDVSNDDEQDEEADPGLPVEEKVVVAKTVKKQKGSSKKNSSKKKKSSKKKTVKKTKTAKKGGNAFTKFMGKKIKELKKKHKKKSHGEIFKMAAVEYKKSKK